MVMSQAVETIKYLFIEILLKSDCLKKECLYVCVDDFYQTKRNVFL